MSPRCPHALSPSALAPEGVVPRLTVYAGSGKAPVQTHGWNLVWRGRERLEQRLMGQLHVWGRLMVFPINTGAQNRSALGVEEPAPGFIQQGLPVLSRMLQPLQHGYTTTDCQPARAWGCKENSSGSPLLQGNDRVSQTGTWVSPKAPGMWVGKMGKHHLRDTLEPQMCNTHVWNMSGIYR